MISELSWSMLDSRPVFARDERFDAHICFWNGIMMTRTYALIIVGSNWNNVFPTMSVKRAAWAEFVKLYGLGVFRDKDWDGYFDSARFDQHHLFLEKQINSENTQFLKSLKTKYSSKEALSWFMNSRELVLSPEVV